MVKPEPRKEDVQLSPKARGWLAVQYAILAMLGALDALVSSSYISGVAIFGLFMVYLFASDTINPIFHSPKGELIFHVILGSLFNFIVGLSLIYDYYF